MYFCEALVMKGRIFLTKVSDATYFPIPMPFESEYPEILKTGGTHSPSRSSRSTSSWSESSKTKKTKTNSPTWTRNTEISASN